MKKNTKKDRYAAFTIIEVMIVLAIAGLIMVVVFIAVPQLQRNVRDHARKGIADRLKAEIETYAGNNQGKYPLGSNIHLGPSGSCPASTTGCITDFVNRCQRYTKRRSLYFLWR
jgi:prepilin-type N-terminal cleavage/methylation domain-containing protein